jgi:hypothetical protein
MGSGWGRSGCYGSSRGRDSPGPSGGRPPQSYQLDVLTPEPLEKVEELTPEPELPHDELLEWLLQEGELDDLLCRSSSSA